jgi:hypothetical protein
MTTNEPCPQCRRSDSHKLDCGLRHTWELDPEPERLSPSNRGRWRITTQGSEHVWDLDAMTATRHHVDGLNPFPIDDRTMHNVTVHRWPVVGDVFQIEYTEQPQSMRTERLQSSTIRSITEERLSPCGADADEERTALCRVHKIARCTICVPAEEPSVERIVDAESAENEERGDICMALREAGFAYEADVLGGETVEVARASYLGLTGKVWRS